MGGDRVRLANILCTYPKLIIMFRAVGEAEAVGEEEAGETGVVEDEVLPEVARALAASSLMQRVQG